MPMCLLCAQFCWRIQICKSINLIAWANTCQINDAEPVENIAQLRVSVGKTFVAAASMQKVYTMQ